MLLLQPIQRLFGRSLLGSAAAGGLGAGDVGEFAQVAGDVETGVAALAGLVLDAIFGQGQAAGLQGFLKQGFRVFALVAQVDVGNAPGKQAAHGLLGGGEIGIEADGGQQGFHGVGQDGGAVEAAAFEFAHAQIQRVAHAHAAGDFGKHVLVDQIGAQAGEFAFAIAGEGVEQHFGHAVIEDGVADKLEAFVVLGAVAAVGERLLEEAGILKAVAEVALQLFAGPGAARIGLRELAGFGGGFAHDGGIISGLAARRRQEMVFR